MQSGLAVYLPTGHGVLASTHVMSELQGQAEICAWQQELAHHLKMMSKPWCCPSVHISHSHTSSLLFPFFVFLLSNNKAFCPSEGFKYRHVPVTFTPKKLLILERCKDVYCNFTPLRPAVYLFYDVYKTNHVLCRC